MGCGNVTLSHFCFKAKTFDAINHAKLVMVQTRQRTCPSRVLACQPKNRYIQFCQTFGKTIKDNEPTVDTSYWCKPDLIHTLFLVQHPCQCGNNRIVQYLLRNPPPVWCSSWNHPIAVFNSFSGKKLLYVSFRRQQDSARMIVWAGMNMFAWARPH